MSLLGNILWLIFGGFFSGLGWIIAGIVWCCTIVGIPVGMQCFKLALMSFLPFGREVRYEGGAVSFIVNVFWFFFGGIELAICNFVWGCILCVTIVGIPFGKQFFKLAKLRGIASSIGNDYTLGMNSTRIVINGQKSLT